MSSNSPAMAAARFRGVYALLLTPFMPNKEIDWTATTGTSIGGCPNARTAYSPFAAAARWSC